VDYFDTPMPRIWLISDARPSVPRDVLGLFNWENDEQTITCAAAKAGLDAAKTYYAFDFWANAPLPPFSGAFSYAVPGQSCRVIGLRAAAGRPTLVSTSRHVSQGIIDVSDERWSQGTKTLSGFSKIVAQDPYELRLAGLDAEAKHWTLESAAVSPADQAAGVTIERKPLNAPEPGWLRVTLCSKDSRSVKWSLKFARR
jgi:hypothetical protein